MAQDKPSTKHFECNALQYRVGTDVETRQVVIEQQICNEHDSVFVDIEQIDGLIDRLKLARSQVISHLRDGGRNQ